MKNRIETVERATFLLAERGVLDPEVIAEVRELEIGFRFVRHSEAIGSSDLLVTRDGRIIRIPAILPDSEVPGS